MKRLSIPQYSATVRCTTMIMLLIGKQIGEFAVSMAELGFRNDIFTNEILWRILLLSLLVLGYNMIGEKYFNSKVL
ncbi:MAG: hypothetical protein HNEKOMLI_00384 [Sodalis sp. Psp]|nr:hypothetical protein [Sodalis sp. Psp]MCR3756867.1 hypothetical protein [Sodalis sp. Ppy]